MGWGTYGKKAPTSQDEILPDESAIKIAKTKSDLNNFLIILFKFVLESVEYRKKDKNLSPQSCALHFPKHFSVFGMHLNNQRVL